LPTRPAAAAQTTGFILITITRTCPGTGVATLPTRETSSETKAGESGGGKKPPVDTKQLFGEGEEAGDLWNEYFKNGKSQIERAKIVIETYDPSKLS